MSFLSRLYKATTTLSSAIYQASVEAFREIIGRPTTERHTESFGLPNVQPVQPLTTESGRLSTNARTLELKPINPALDVSNIEPEVEHLMKNVSLKTYTYNFNGEVLIDFDQLLDPARALLDTFAETGENLKMHFKITYDYNGRELIESTKYSPTIQEAYDLLEKLFYKIMENYDGIQLKTLQFQIIGFPTILLMQGSKFAKQCVDLPEAGTLKRINKDQMIYSPLTQTNCLFHSICVSMNPTLIGRERSSTNKGKSFLVDSARKLKENSGCRARISDLADAERVAKYSKITINIYDKTMRLIDTFKGGNRYEVDLLVNNQHCYSIINYSEELDKKLQKINDKKSDTMKKIKPLTQKDTNFYAADLEAFTNEKNHSVAYAIGYGYYKKIIEDDEEKKIEYYKEFIGHKDCIKRFMESLVEDKTNKTVYFHNGGKYDINVIIHQFLLEDDKFKIDNHNKVYLNGRYAKFVVVYEKTVLTFLDSICLFSLSLEKATGKKGFDVKTKKLAGNIDHRKVTEDNYHQVMSEGTGTGVSGSQYLRNDVIGLLECIDVFGTEIWDSYQINITKLISASSISKRIFKQKFLKDEWPIFMLSKEQDAFIRESYSGGRTECFYKGTYNNQIEGVPNRTGKLYYYDFTSLYPSVCAVGDCGMPYGRPHPINRKLLFKPDEIIHSERDIQYLRDHYLFFKCLVKTVDKTKVPIHCITTGRHKRLTFPIFEDWTEVHITSDEMLYGIENKINEYKVLDVIAFKKAPVLKEFFLELFSKKQEASSQGLEAKAQCYKIIANSGYGFWALRTEDRPDVDIFSEKDFNNFLLRVMNDFDDIYQTGDKIVVSYKKDIDNSEKNIALGSACTSKARLRIVQLIQAIKDKGHQVLYCDTDSVITDIRLEDHQDLMEEFMWDGCGGELGALKNEIKDAVKKECIKQGIPVQDKDCIDKAFFAGLKSYRYYLEFEYGGKTYEVSDSKLKGYKQYGEFTDPEDNVRRLKDPDYEILLTGESITQKVSQFTSNKKGKYQDWQKITQIPKEFKYSYSKGRILEDGSITPWLIPDDLEHINSLTEID